METNIDIRWYNKFFKRSLVIRNNYPDDILFYYELQFSILFLLRVFIVFNKFFLFHTFCCIYLMFALLSITCQRLQTGNRKLVKVTVYLQRENFWIFIFLDRNKLPSKFLQTKKEFSKKSEYSPRNWDVSDFHRKLNFTLIDSILLPVNHPLRYLHERPFYSLEPLTFSHFEYLVFSGRTCVCSSTTLT